MKKTKNPTAVLPRPTWTKLTACASALALSASLAQAQDQEEEDVYTLSPFVVEAESDVGYAATETLSGTRIRTSLSDLAAPIDVLTMEFLEDIGATNLDDALEYGVNSAEWNGNLLTEDQGLPLTGFADNIQLEIRGFPSQSITRDFFTSVYKPDNYNSSRLTMSRGPNAILYGIGSPAGVVDSSSSRAMLNRSKGRVSLKTDNNGSFRATFDYNKPLIEDKLAVRVSAMTEDREGWRENDSKEDDRVTVAFTAKATENTEIRASYEQGSHSSVYSPPWPAYDGFSSWVDAGSQLDGAVGTVNPGIPAKAIDRLTNTPYLVDASLSAAGSDIPALSWRRMGVSSFPTVGALLNRPSSLLDESVVRFDQNLIGPAKSLDQHFESMSLFVNQKVTQNFHLEFGYNYQDSDKDAWSGLAGGAQPLVRVDTNLNLPNGDPNPNAGMYFVDSSNIAIYSKDITEQQESMRLSGSYSLDFREQTPWLGRHDFAALLQRVDFEKISPSLDLFNLTPGEFNAANGLRGATAFPTALTNPRNKVKLRYYFDPATGETVMSKPDIDQYRMIYSGGALPAADPSGYTPGLLAARPQSNVFRRVDSMMGVLMSRFWNDRIITTLGVREDTQEIWTASRAAGPDGIFINPHMQDARVDTETFDSKNGQTTTKGIVFKATENLSFTYGVSDTFSPNGDLRNVLGELIPATTAEGTDFGVRLNLLENKFNLGLNFYETEAKGLATAYVRVIGGNSRGPINNIWGPIEEFTGDPKYGDAPYKENSAWSGVMDQNAEGMEFVMTANPTTQWRLKLSVTQQEAVLSNVAPGIIEYLDLITPILEDPANAEWLALEAGGRNTVATRFADLQRQVARKRSIDGVKNTNQAEWAVNFVNNYTFSKEGPLKGWAFGQSARFRSASGIGYGDDPETGGFDTDNVFEGDDSLIVGAWLSYRTKVGDGQNLKLQLNVDNVFDEGLLNPHEALDDGNGNPIITRYRFINPRRFSLTATLDF